MTPEVDEMPPTDLTDAEQELMDRWERDDEEQAAFYETVGGGKLYRFLLESGTAPRLADIAKIMREGVEPPKMLLDGWLVEGELHWLFAEAEAGKTWLALHLSWQVMRAGGIVVYFDEELGENIIAERLLAIGVPAKLIETNFVYAPFPSWGRDVESLARHERLMRDLSPQLVVYDTVTDMLALVGADENSGLDVTVWVKAFPEVARRAGATQLVLDHVGKSDKRSAVGSRAKRAKAKVMYRLSKATGGARFTPSRTGTVVVELDKNTRGADIADRREFEIGGTPFQWEPTGTQVLADDIRITSEITQHVTANPGDTMTKLLDAVRGNKETKRKVLDGLIEGGQLVVEKGDHNAKLISLAKR